MSASILRGILGKRAIPFYPAMARVCGSVNAAILAAQVAYWQDKMGREFYKSREDWVAETGLSLRELDTARKKLKSAGVLKERKQFMPTRVFYSLDFEVLARLAEPVFASPRTSTCVVQVPQDSPAHSAEPVQESTTGDYFSRSTHPSGGDLFEGLDTDTETKPKAKPKGYSASFEAFWETASRAWRAAAKVPGSKKEAWVAWEKIPAADRPSPESATKWLAAHKRVQAMGVFPGGVQHLCRWLKGHRWADDWIDAPPSEGFDVGDWEQRALADQEETRRMLREQRDS